MERVTLSMDSNVDKIMTLLDSDNNRAIISDNKKKQNWSTSYRLRQKHWKIQEQYIWYSVVNKETANCNGHMTNYCTKQHGCWLAQSVGQRKGHSMNFQLTNNQLKWHCPWKSSKSSGFLKVLAKNWEKMSTKNVISTSFVQFRFRLSFPQFLSVFRDCGKSLALCIAPAHGIVFSVMTQSSHNNISSNNIQHVNCLFSHGWKAYCRHVLASTSVVPVFQISAPGGAVLHHHGWQYVWSRLRFWNLQG